MLLTLTTTHQPATDLGYLLAKHPQRVQTFALNFGQAHVVYPEANDGRCTAALLLDINPVKLVRRDNHQGFTLEQYVNDRPYASSSFLSVALAQVYGSALNGTSRERPELAQTAIPLTAKITALPSRGGEGLLRRLFEPLGYTLTIERYPLDPVFTAWGDSAYFTITLEAVTQLQELLAHLYVLIPVLDDDKHYYVDKEEVEKLLRHGEGWLKTHPERDLITRRYLRHHKSLTRAAFERLSEGEPEVETSEQADAPEQLVEAKISLHTQRLQAVQTVILASGASRVVDLGCGEGRLLQLLVKQPQIKKLVGMDVSHRALEIAAERLGFDRPNPPREKLTLLHGSLMYRDARLSGFDAAAVVEVIEHLDQPRLSAFERSVFEFARPALVVITTPNVEYNVKWETLPAGKFRHNDHRFEWSRAEFSTWAESLCTRYGYTVEYQPIGEIDETVGSPTQMGIFRRVD